jgi:hypothetical protein
MSCENSCFEASIESCNDIVVRAGFPANYPLYWIICKAGSNNLKQRLTLTNVNGDLVIPQSDLPAGYLLTGNFYKIQVKNGNDYLQPVTFVFGGTQHTCIICQLLSFDRDEFDNSEINVIQFKEAVIPGTPSSPGNSIVYPFVNQTSFTYNHSLGRIVSVTAYDLSGTVLFPTIVTLPPYDEVTITFGSPTTGRILIL